MPANLPSDAPTAPSPVAATPLVVVDSIAKTFDVSPPWLNRLLEGKPRLLLHAVDDVSFEIARGETLALVGESGCGKSTIARMLVGLYKPSRGQVRFDGVDLSDLSSPAGRQMRSRLQMIFQDPYASLNPRWKVADIIAEWKAGGMQVTPEHFRRWGQTQMPGSTVEELMSSGRSIHVHFYIAASMDQLLAQTSSQIGFRRFSITNEPNHKDFFVVLEK
jgi:ABC-type glutathione transport system ATPase component